MNQQNLVGSVHFDDELARFQFDDLRPIVSILETVGVSCVLDRPAVSSPYGIVVLRIVHDYGGRAFLYRSDDAETTRFEVRWVAGAA